MIFDIQNTVAQVCAVQRTIDGEGLAKFSRTAGEIAQFLEPAPGFHEIKSCHRLRGSDQHCGGMILTLRYQVQHVIEPINEIHVSVTCRSKHHFRAGGPSLRCVTREILRSDISFGFNDTPNGQPFGMLAH